MNSYKTIFEYEKSLNLNDSQKTIEYIPQYDDYMPKVGIDTALIKERYDEALNALNKNAPKITAIYRITLNNNIKDQAEYNEENFKSMLNSFTFDDYVQKELLLKVGDKLWPLLIIRKGMEFPEFTDTEENLCKIAIEYQQKWFISFIELIHEKEMNENEKLLEISKSSLAAKQPGINYTKEIRKAMESRMVIKDKKMAGFDFREVPLARVIFINCNLTKANFSHVDLTDTVFINCQMEKAVFYKAETGNMTIINDWRSENENN